MQIWSILSGFKKSWVAQTWKDTFCFRSDEDFMFTRMNNLDLKCPLISTFSGWAEDSSSARIFHPCYIQRNSNTENVNWKKLKVLRSIDFHHRVYCSFPFGQLLSSEMSPAYYEDWVLNLGGRFTCSLSRTSLHCWLTTCELHCEMQLCDFASPSWWLHAMSRATAGVRGRLSPLRNSSSFFFCSPRFLPANLWLANKCVALDSLLFSDL